MWLFSGSGKRSDCGGQTTGGSAHEAPGGETSGVAAASSGRHQLVAERSQRRNGG